MKNLTQKESDNFCFGLMPSGQNRMMYRDCENKNKVEKRGKMRNKIAQF